MKRLLAGIAVALAMAAVWANGISVAHAAPLDAADVAAGAKWLVHIDFDAARESKLGEHILSQVRKNEHVQKELAKLRDELGIDPQKDLHGATLYGTEFTQHAGVLILYATFDTDKVVSYLRTKPDFAASKTDSGLDVYTWTANVGPEKKHTVWGAFPKSGVSVMSDSAESLKAAVAVIGGKGGLATSSPLLADAPKGTILHGAVVGLTAAKLPVQNPIAKKIDDVHFAVGESEGDDFIKVKVNTTDANTAKQLKSTVDGFSGIIALQAGQNPEAQQLLKNLKVDAQDKELTLNWSAPADDLIKLGEKMREQRGQQRPGLPGGQPAPGNSEGK